MVTTVKTLVIVLLIGVICVSGAQGGFADVADAVRALLGFGGVELFTLPNGGRFIDYRWTDCQPLTSLEAGRLVHVRYASEERIFGTFYDERDGDYTCLQLFRGVFGDSRQVHPMHCAHHAMDERQRVQYLWMPLNGTERIMPVHIERNEATREVYIVGLTPSRQLRFVTVNRYATSIDDMLLPYEVEDYDVDAALRLRILGCPFTMSFGEMSRERYGVEKLRHGRFMIPSVTRDLRDSLGKVSHNLAPARHIMDIGSDIIVYDDSDDDEPVQLTITLGF